MDGQITSAPQLTKGQDVCYHVYVIDAHKRTSVDYQNMPNYLMANKECAIKQLQKTMGISPGGCAEVEMQLIWKEVTPNAAVRMQ